MKKLLTFLLTMLSVLSLCAEPITVSLDASKLPSSWSKVYIYYWGGSEAGTSWPGEELTASEGWYSKTFDEATTSINIIWNNGEGKQTGNIEGVTETTCYENTSETAVQVVDCQSPSTEPRITSINVAGSKLVNEELTFTANVAGFSGEPAISYSVKAGEGDYQTLDGNTFTPDAAGDYTVKADASFEEETATKESQFTVTEEAAGTVYYLRGEFNGWAASDEYKFTSNGNHIYTLEKEFELSGSFKIADADWSKSHTWGLGDGGSFAIDVEFSVVTDEAAGKSTANIECDDTYNVTKIILTTSASTLKIETAAPSTEPRITSIDVAGSKLVNEELTFTANVAGFSGEPAISYSVKAGEGDYQTLDGNTFTPDAAGDYTVKAEASFEEETATKESQFTVTEESQLESWTVAGEVALMGSNWDPADIDNDMEFVGGAYQLTREGVVLEAKTYEYKMVANHAWGGNECPSSGNYSIEISEAGTYDVVFTLDAMGTEGGATATLVGPAPEPSLGVTVNVEVPTGTPSCAFYGALSDNAFVDMDIVDETHYTITFADKTAADLGWGYKFCWENGNWATQAEPETTYDATDGSMNIVLGWRTEPGTSYSYTTYTEWNIKYAPDWEWESLAQVESSNVWTANITWGGTGVNIGSCAECPIKKDWYPADQIEGGDIETGTTVTFTLTVEDDETVSLKIVDPSAAEEAEADAKATTYKVVENGQVIIVTPAGKFNLLGAPVE